MKTNWIDWHGGKRPVRKGALIEVMFRDGEITKDNAPSADIIWEHGFGNGDIVAFRIVYDADHEEAPQ